MAVYKRGEQWWYEFSFQGQRIRESAHTTSKTAAIQIERERRRKLELSSGGVWVQKPLLFSAAAKAWLAENAHWSQSTREIYALKVRHLGPSFGKFLLNEITPSSISGFQRKRQTGGASNREINMECAALRMILRKHRLWHFIAPDYRPMREREDTGKALSSDETHRLLSAAKKSRSLSLYPALILLMNTGLRVSELRTLQWRQIDLLDRFLTVGRSKTKGGEGRVVPLNQDAFAALMDWRKSFENPLPSHFVFPPSVTAWMGRTDTNTGPWWSGIATQRRRLEVGSWHGALAVNWPAWLAACMTFATRLYRDSRRHKPPIKRSWLSPVICRAR